MYDLLRQRAGQGARIGVALVGAGRMGFGIAHQLRRVPGMELRCVVDIDLAAAEAAARAYGAPYVVVRPQDAFPRGAVAVATDAFGLIGAGKEFGIDVLVESTNTIGFAARICETAITSGVDVVLMNAEVDLALGPALQRQAERNGRIVTSDAGDQHGVLARMIDEIRLWGLDIAMAGNIKGFLDRYATARGLEHEARIRKLNPVQCCAYTDGTKLNIEMALVANGTGLVPPVPGMRGPRLRHVNEVLGAFDFARHANEGVVDYILGAEPGGGVFVVGHGEDPLARDFLDYYKMGAGPFYLFYRPYHLCSLETPWAIASAVCLRQPVLRPAHGRVADVYAYAKRDIEAGEAIPAGIGGDHCYGLIDRCATADRDGRVPIALLEGEGAHQARARRRIAKDQPLGHDDVRLPETELTALCLAEIKGGAPPTARAPGR